MPEELITVTDRGLHCAAGGFTLDPWRPVERALVTHAHADHARRGSAAYLCAAPSVGLLRRRLDDGAAIEGVGWGAPLSLGGVEVSFHPAGHVLGSAQIRIEGQGASGRRERWVVTGDYKRAADPTCEAFEPVSCDVLVTEATFALPVYRWDPAPAVAAEIAAWWAGNRAAGRASLVCAYSLGKAQRLLAELAPWIEGPVYTHGAVESMTAAYREAGVELPPTVPVSEAGERTFAGELVLAPPAAAGSPWVRRLGDVRTGFASGWMRVRGARRRRGFDRGFALSDHADWPGLIQTVDESGAGRVLTTHGYSAPLARYLTEERGLAAQPLGDLYAGDEDE